MKFKNGDRVIYTSDKYTLQKNNPLWGSKYACVGTVYENKKEGSSYPLRVYWDNGTDNTYEENDLEYYRKEFKMIESAKKVAMETNEFIKPYRKYIGLAAVALVIDHFVLGDKFSDRFKSLASAVVERTTNIFDKLIDKLKIEDTIEPKGEEDDDK